VGDTCY